VARERILIVDDEPDIRDVVRLTLESEGYEVHEAGDGMEALDRIRSIHPHLILLDFKMPRLDGTGVCQAVRKDIVLRHLPIIMLTSKAEVSDKVEGIRSGADDYLTKPFEPAELLARVRMVLRRTAQALDANPLTKLPGNASILEELQKRIHENQPWAVCYIDLDQFKAFNDVYGFERGDEVIRSVARILLETMQTLGTADDFLGHIGGDDFVLITHPKRVEPICQTILAEVRKAACGFYNEQDRQRGYIEAKDREGRLRRFPLLTASIAVVSNEQKHIHHVAEIAQRGAELKAWIKSQGGNLWARDRRVE